MTKSITKIVDNYANALFDSVSKKQKKEVGSALNNIIEAVTYKKEFWNLISSPVINYSTKMKIFDILFKTLNIENKELEKFISLIIKHSRISLLQMIAEAYKKLCLEEEGIKNVVVTSSKKLDKKAIEWIKDYLKNILQSETSLIFKINPKIISGLVIQYDSMKIDMSVLGSLGVIKKIATSVN
jgi:F-type H+-transporting ATPase subunit delta